MKKSEINFIVTLDENHVPEKIEWSATDATEDHIRETKSILVSLWDKLERNTLRMDLWTKDMTIDEMKHFFYQSIITMGDTYEQATNDSQFAKEIRDLGVKMGERIKKEKMK